MALGLTTESFQDWSPLASKSLAGMLTEYVQWWNFEIGTFLSGKIYRSVLMIVRLLRSLNNATRNCYLP